MRSKTKSEAVTVQDQQEKWLFERDKSALIVVDMQNDFVADGAIMQVPAAKEQVPKIKALIKRCRETGVPVIYTVHETDAAFNPPEIAAFPHLINAGMRRGTAGIEVIDALKPAAGDTVIQKRRFSAFYQTDLELILRNLKNRSLDTVIICGTVTNICCESTARDAFFRDFKVVFGSDICSALTPEAHRATLDNMQIFGRVMNYAGIADALEKGRG